MDMDRIKTLIIGFALVSLIAAAGSIALNDFQSDVKGSNTVSISNETVTLVSGVGDLSEAAYYISISAIRNITSHDNLGNCNVSTGRLTCNTTPFANGSLCYADFSRYALTHHLNITDNGLLAVDNTTSYFGTAGTIAGVAFLLTIVIGAFYFITKRA